jgi:DNA-binding transcriptional ArsR family regulator
VPQGLRVEEPVLQAFKAELFKAVGHPVRIRILEVLRDGEQTVSGLQLGLAVDAGLVSQHLAVLRGRQLVAGRKEGTNVYYRVTDPQVFALLDTARTIFDRHLITLQAMANEDLLGIEDAHGVAGVSVARRP